MITLLDLSNNNPPPDFHAIKKGGAFGVLMKVSEATTFTDPTWPARAAAARSAGLHVGGYHFAQPESGDAVTQADYFCTRLGSVGRRDLHPALDLEANEHGLHPIELLSWTRRFLARVYQRTGVRCITYSYSAFIDSQDWRERPGTGAGLWLADYGPNDGHDHGATAPAPWKRIVAHQYTSAGTWPGVTGHVDLSHARSRRAVLAHGLRGIVRG